MTRFLRLALLLSLATGGRLPAAAPLGQIARAYPFQSPRVLADPGRSREYALVPATNSVAVIDTTTLDVIATVFIGSNPVDLAMSADGNTLYVANSGSSVAAIGVINLNTLTAGTAFALPNPGVAVAAGLGNRLYAAAGTDPTVIYQLDGATGAQQRTVASGYYGVLLEMSPDRKTLYAADPGTYPGSLAAYDVSTATPTLSQSNTNSGDSNFQLVVSHNGTYVCSPSSYGNGIGGSDTTALFSAANLSTDFGVLNNGAAPGALAFSPDDSQVMQVQTGGDVLQVFNTQTYALTAQVPIPVVSSAGVSGTTYADASVETTGSYIFLAPQGGTSAVPLTAVTTGAGTLTPASVLPVITSATTAEASVGLAFSYQIVATNTPASYGAVGLPAGLSVDATTGLISGTPTSESSDYTEYAVQLTATNASGTYTASLSLDVEYDEYTITIPDATATGVAGSSFTYYVSASGSPNLFSAYGLPAGLAINQTTGEITGVTAQTGTFTVTIQASDEYDDYGQGTLTLIIDPAPGIPVITSATTASAAVGQPFSYTILATNSPASFNGVPLPGGLSIDASTGVISGTPLVAGVFQVDLTATDAAGSGGATLVLTVAPAAPAITSAASVVAHLGQPFQFQVTATNSPTAFTASGLPPGLTIGSSTGRIVGTPTQLGVSNVTLGVSNTGGAGTGSLLLTVAVPTPVITSAATASGLVQAAFSYQITATNAPTGYSATGLPAGLSLDATTGLITGAPAAVGVYAVQIAATNAGGTTPAALTLTFVSAFPTVTVTATTPTTTLGGAPGILTLTRTGDTSAVLVVTFVIKGSGVNGVDYRLLQTTRKIKAGKASAAVKIYPQGDLDGASKKTVKIVLAAQPGYQLGAVLQAKVKILAPSGL